MRIITLRVDEPTYQELAAVRQREGVKSQSALLRQAVRQFLATRRRQQFRRELAEYAKDRENLRRMAELADADFLGAMDLTQPDRGATALAAGPD